MTISDLKKGNLILLECISGSRAYGLDTETSDTDIKGVFYLPKDQFYGLSYIEQVSNATNDEVYYELGRFIELLIRNNPNILELLATPEESVLYRHPIMHQLQPQMFLSRLCKESFAGYALTQVKKARGYKKKVVNPVDQERKSVLDFCYVVNGHTSIPLSEWLGNNAYKQNHCGLASIPHSKGLYALYYGAGGSQQYKGIASGDNANDVSLSSIPPGEEPAGHLFFNKEHYSMYCREYKEYWEWVEKRNEQRYQGNREHGKDYDAKNMMHTIRLLQVAEEIATAGRLNVRRNNREELLAIKKGAFEYDDLLLMADALMARIERAYPTSSLPEAPDRAVAEKILVDMRTELYDNWDQDPINN